MYKNRSSTVYLRSRNQQRNICYLDCSICPVVKLIITDINCRTENKPFWCVRFSHWSCAVCALHRCVMLPQESLKKLPTGVTVVPRVFIFKEAFSLSFMVRALHWEPLVRVDLCGFGVQVWGIAGQTNLIPRELQFSIGM